MANILHKIKAWLYNNPLTDNPNDLVARVVSDRTLSVKDLCESAVERGKSDIPAQALQHAVEIFLPEMDFRLCDGFTVNVGSFTASSNIRGVFNGPNDRFDPERHTFLFEFHQGATLRKEIESVTIEILGVAILKAHIDSVFDVKSGTTNDLLTSGRNLKIAGRDIKILGDEKHPETGVYFVCQDPESVGTRLKVDPTDVVVNNPSEVVILIPEFAGQTYKLEIITQFAGSSRLLNDPRTLTLDRVLTVAGTPHP
jgi:hypothetical protein